MLRRESIKAACAFLLAPLAALLPGLKGRCDKWRFHAKAARHPQQPDVEMLTIDLASDMKEGGWPRDKWIQVRARFRLHEDGRAYDIDYLWVDSRRC